jgi:predicted NAD-dependent protein-ADP-ribosyltransferase YbiA (DUF1768 family)
MAANPYRVPMLQLDAAAWGAVRQRASGMPLCDSAQPTRWYKDQHKYGANRVLSHMGRCTIELPSGLVLDSTERGLHVAKCRDYCSELGADVWRVLLDGEIYPTPWAVKMSQRLATMTPDDRARWNADKLNIVTLLNVYKFDQDDNLKRFLCYDTKLDPLSEDLGGEWGGRSGGGNLAGLSVMHARRLLKAKRLLAVAHEQEQLRRARATAEAREMLDAPPAEANWVGCVITPDGDLLPGTRVMVLTHVDVNDGTNCMLVQSVHTGTFHRVNMESVLRMDC